MSDHLHCIGCGGPLQNHDPEAAFYTPKAMDSQETLLCQRCFRLRHYGAVSPSYYDEFTMRKTLDAIGEDEGALVWVIDAFDFEGTLPPALIKLSQQKPTFIVLNKRDVLPKVINDQKLLHHVKKRFAQDGIRYRDILFVSAKKKMNIDLLLERLDAFEPNRNLYLMGATNVGKSSLLNAMLKAVGVRQEPITTSKQEATTQGLIPIPFENRILYDTPGLLLEHSIQRFLAANEAYVLLSDKEIQGRTYQLEADQTLFIGGLIQIDVTQASQASITIYTSQSLKLHRRKREDSDAFFDKHVGTLLVPPAKAQLVYRFSKLQTLGFAKEDLVLPGIGFVTLRGIQSLRVRHPEKMRVFLKEAII
jgi:ribosome biogenesis GTPase YqeH